MNNIYSSLPVEFKEEVFEELLRSTNVRIERIISRGHSSSEQEWYDQTDNEWVIVLEGSGTILFENGIEATLGKGDYLNIPSHTRHRVAWTDPDHITVWLAIFYA